MKNKLIIAILLFPILLYGKDKLTYSFCINYSDPSIFLGDAIQTKLFIEEIYVGYGLVSNRGILNFKAGLRHKNWSISPLVGLYLPKLEEIEYITWPIHCGFVLQYSDQWDFASIELPLYNTSNSLCSEYNNSIVLRFGFLF
jgi:hypothetical protein